MLKIKLRRVLVTPPLSDPSVVENLIENQFLQKNNRIATLVVFCHNYIISSFRRLLFRRRILIQPEFKSRRIAWGECRIVAAARTAVGSFNGSLAGISAATWVRLSFVIS